MLSHEHRRIISDTIYNELIPASVSTLLLVEQPTFLSNSRVEDRRIDITGIFLFDSSECLQHPGYRSVHSSFVRKHTLEVDGTKYNLILTMYEMWDFFDLWVYGDLAILDILYAPPLLLDPVMHPFLSFCMETKTSQYARSILSTTGYESYRQFLEVENSSQHVSILFGPNMNLEYLKTLPIYPSFIKHNILYISKIYKFYKDEEYTSDPPVLYAFLQKLQLNALVDLLNKRYENENEEKLLLTESQIQEYFKLRLLLSNIAKNLPSKCSEESKSKFLGRLLQLRTNLSIEERSD